jgi:hypothetical protein
MCFSPAFMSKSAEAFSGVLGAHLELLDVPPPCQAALDVMTMMVMLTMISHWLI